MEGGPSPRKRCPGRWRTLSGLWAGVLLAAFALAVAAAPPTPPAQPGADAPAEAPAAGLPAVAEVTPPDSRVVVRATKGTPGGPVYVVRIEGTVDLGMAPMLVRAIKEAEEAGAAGLLLDMNTLGGRVDAALLMRDALLDTALPTTCYVNHRAISAGALICLAAGTIDMSPGSTMGAATPVTEKDGEMTAADAKVMSYVRKEFGTTAEARERRRDIAEAMVDRSLVVEGLTKEGELLTLTTDEALRTSIATRTSATLDEALDAAGLSGLRRVDIVMGWAEKAARALTNPILSGMLLSLGFLGILFELKTPGFGVPGKVGLLALLIFFAGHHMALLAGWEHLALMLVGIVLLALEVFVIPGFGVAGLAGIVSLLAGALLAMTGNDWSEAVIFGRLHDAIVTLAGAVVGTSIALPLLAHWLPRSKFAQRSIILGDSLDTSDDPAAFARDLGEHVGRHGTAHTMLRPSGTVLIDDERLDAVSEGEVIVAGTPVLVVAIRGANIVVRASLPPAEPSTPASTAT